MTIFQGQNDPLELLWPTLIEDGDKISASLTIEDEVVKSWYLPEVDEDIFYLDLTEEETMNFRPSLGELEIKVMDKDGHIRFCQELGVAIIERNNKHIYGGNVDG